MSSQKQIQNSATILFAGDSGDGIQLTGSQFSNTTALYGNDLSTFPDFPAEIRAPIGTVPGVSGFQVHFGSNEVFTPGDQADVLVAMNAAALKKNKHLLKKGGFIIANTSGFDKRNLKLAHIEESDNPLTNGSLDRFQLFEIDISGLTRECLADIPLGKKEKERSKNMFVLGFVYWLYNRDLKHTLAFLEGKFVKKPLILEANTKALKAGYHFGDTSETFSNRYEIKPATLPKGAYRSISGNQALALGLIAAAQKAGLELFYGGYPITPASDILHELSKHKNFGVKTFQAEDEIAGITAAIGASFGGSLGVTASSGPGIALKAEALGLAVMLELPLVVINVQRGGPSTGLPTKTEQADLLQALYGRNGEAPIPVLAAQAPSDCFQMAFEACRIAIEHMTPVILLSDGYIANGAEPWRFPCADSLKKITPPFAEEQEQGYLPYKRDKAFVRKWAIPGTKGLEHRVGGLEKEHETGHVSYNPENHEKMVRLRAQRIEQISRHIPKQKTETGPASGKLLVLTWGSTYGAVKTAVRESIDEGYEVSHTHLKYLYPMPANTESLIKGFEKVLIPEMNAGQLVKVIRDRFLIDAVGMHKIKGVPFQVAELKDKIVELLSN